VAAEMSPLTERMSEVLAPLGEEEERRAIEAALAAGGGSRETLIVRGAELLIEKARPRSERPFRRVRVLLTAPGESVVREVLVDSEGSVVSDRDLGPRNLPFLESEVEQARAVAERDERVARRLAGYKVGVGSFAPSLDGAGRHRLVGLRFLDLANPDLPQQLIRVVVDLATGQLVPEAHHGHESHGEA